MTDLIVDSLPPRSKDGGTRDIYSGPKGCCRGLSSGHFGCMGEVLRAESLWVETFTGLRMDRF
ncbi:hypothetical protein, partial [Streptomyces diastaticus]|uniref:hypothetical protein n=1 Tax=Streptomyces diastaticus TaxID=1956 RepID=UPI00380D5E41